MLAAGAKVLKKEPLACILWEYNLLVTGSRLINYKREPQVTDWFISFCSPNSSTDEALLVVWGKVITTKVGCAKETTEGLLAAVREF